MLSLFFYFSFGDNQQPKNEHVMILVGSLICVRVFWNYDDIFALQSKSFLNLICWLNKYIVP